MKLLTISSVILVILLSLTGQVMADSRPNIIYLMADDQNFRSVGIYGNAEVKTPHMDKLGRDGIVFDRHYNTTAICMASRASVVSGMYEYKAGANFGHGNMSTEIWSQSYPVLLREAGYFTAFGGKFGFMVDGYKYDLSSFFDMWGGGPRQTTYETKKNKSMEKYAKEYPHSTLSYAAFSKDVIKEALKQNKPFCLSISFKAPHRPTTPDPQFDHIYAGKTFSKPAHYGRENGKHLSEQSRQGRQYNRFKEWGYDQNYDKVMATYYQQIYAIDVALGMIRKELEVQGIADNTVIIYTSDNGFLCGAHGYGSKVLPLEDSSRAPLMIYDPRSASAGKELRSPALTGNIDFAPTLFELAGIAIPENVDGVSLVPLLSDPAQDVREQLAFMNVYGPDPTESLTVITKDAKYTYWWYGNDTMSPTEELFHLGSDPLEMNNLAENPEATPLLHAMRKKYDFELNQWKIGSIKNTAYHKYIELFDRNIPLGDKEFNRMKKKSK